MPLPEFVDHMRIGIDIHTIGARQTGNETYMRNLVSNLVKQKKSDMDFFLYHTKGVGIPRWEATYRKLVPHNPLLRIPIGFPLSLKYDKIDVAHFQYVIPPVSPCPSTVAIHDISFEFFPDFFHPLSRKRMQLLIPYSAKKSAHVITISEYSKRQIIEKYNIPDNKVTVTYLGVSDLFQVIADKNRLADATARFGLGEAFILAVGNLQPRKNIERLVRVYAQLRKKGLLSHDLVLVGQKQWQSHAIFDAVKKNRVERHVIITGYVTDDELVALYNRADFFVYPSLYEGFGLPVIESMACGTPVITSNTSSLPEVAGNAALLIDPRSDDELAKAMLRLAESSDLRDTLIRRGEDQAKKFSWEKAAKQTLSVMERCA